MTDQPSKYKTNFLSQKAPVPEPFEWIAIVGIGLIPRKEYEAMGYAGTPPLHMIGFNGDIQFPVNRISGESLDDIKNVIIQSIENLFSSAAGLNQSSTEPGVSKST